MVDGRNSWQTLSTDTTKDLFSVQFIDEKNGIITGLKGTLLHSNDGGNSWNAEDPGLGSQQNLMNVSFLDGSHAWVAGSGGIILRSNQTNH